MEVQISRIWRIIAGYQVGLEATESSGRGEMLIILSAMLIILLYRFVSEPSALVTFMVKVQRTFDFQATMKFPGSIFSKAYSILQVEAFPHFVVIVSLRIVNRDR